MLGGEDSYTFYLWGNPRLWGGCQEGARNEVGDPSALSDAVWSELVRTRVNKLALGAQFKGVPKNSVIKINDVFTAIFFLKNY